MMRLSVFYLLLLALGCKKVDKLTQFNLEYTQEVVVPASTGIQLPFNLFTPDIQTNSASSFAVHDTRKDLVQKISLTSLTLTLTQPDHGDFGFLKSVEIFISADGLPTEKVAWKENIPDDGSKQLTLETSGADLKEYLKKDEFTLKLTTVTDEVLQSDHHIDVHSLFFVNAGIIGK